MLSTLSVLISMLSTRHALRGILVAIAEGAVVVLLAWPAIFLVIGIVRRLWYYVFRYFLGGLLRYYERLVQALCDWGTKTLR